MAKKSPHKRKKNTTKAKAKPIQPIELSAYNDEAQITANTTDIEERSWSVKIVAVFIIFIVLSSLLIFLNNKRDNNTPSAIPIDSATSSGQGIIIEGGNLGQISNPATSGLQSNANPLGGTSEPASPSANSGGQNGQLQPTIDKCTYNSFEQSASQQCIQR